MNCIDLYWFNESFPMFGVKSCHHICLNRFEHLLSGQSGQESQDPALPISVRMLCDKMGMSFQLRRSVLTFRIPPKTCRPSAGHGNGRMHGSEIIYRYTENALRVGGARRHTYAAWMNNFVISVTRCDRSGDCVHQHPGLPATVCGRILMEMAITDGRSCSAVTSGTTTQQCRSNRYPRHLCRGGAPAFCGDGIPSPSDQFPIGLDARSTTLSRAG